MPTMDEIEAELRRRGALSGPQQTAPSPDMQAVEAELARRGVPVPTAVPDPNAGHSLKNLARQAGQGLTFGFADELEAAVRAPVSARSREEIQADIQGQNTAYETAHPVVSTGTQIAGGLLTGGVGAGRVAGAKALQSLPKVARMLGGGAVTGGLTGAVSGAGYAEKDKPAGAITGGILGATLGAGIPAVASAAGKVIKPAAQFAMDHLGRNPGQVAQRKVREALQRDKLTPESAVAKMQGLGDEATLVDVGPNVSGLAEGIASRPGAPLERATDLFTQRRAGQANRILGHLDDAVGPPGKELAEAASPRFAEALQIQIPIDEEFAKFLARPSLKQGWARAQQLAAEEDMVLPSHEAVLKSVQAGELQGLSTKVAHWLKKGLDDTLEGKRDPITKKLPVTNEVYGIENTRRAYRALVKDKNPLYAKELDRLAGSKRLEGAYADGTKFMRLKNPQEAARQIGTLSNDAQKREFKRGVRDAIETAIANDSERGYDTTRKILGQANKLRAIFGDDVGESIIQRVKAERTMAQSEGRILGNSRTAFRQAAMQEGGLRSGRKQTFGEAMARGHRPRQCRQWRPLMRSAGNKFRPGMSEPVSDKIGDLLFQPGPTAAEQLAKLLGQKSSRVRFPMVPGATQATIQQGGRWIAP